MDMGAPLVQRVDHLIVRVADPNPLFKLLTQRLQLPEAWPVSTNPIFSSGGIFLGNLNLDIRRLRQDAPPSDRARLYGLGFELLPFEHSLPALDERGIAHTPPMPFFQVDDQGWQVTTWTSVFLGGLLGESTTGRMFFSLSQRAPKETWEKGSLPSAARRPYGLPYIYQRVFPRGLVYAIEYNPAWRSKHIRQVNAHTGLDVRGVYEITIGTRNMTTARACWKALLAGYPEVESNVWRLPGNLHIHLVPHIHNELLSMIWQVASLNRSAQFLHRQGLLGKEDSTGLTIDSNQLQGLSIRLIS